MKELVVGSVECSLRTVVSVIIRDTIIRKHRFLLAIGLGLSKEEIDRLEQDMKLGTITYPNLIYNILHSWIALRGKRAFISDLLQVVEDDCGALCIGESLRMRFFLPSKEAEGDQSQSIEWKNLSVLLQKRVVKTLQKHLPNYSFDSVLHCLRGNPLTELTVARIPSLFKNTLPETLAYYVPRTVLSRNIISHKIFSQCTQKDIFLFTGINTSELSRLAGDNLTSSSKTQLRGAITVKFILLNREKDFEKICKKTTQPVHLLHIDSQRKIRWLKSKNGMGSLLSFVNPIQDEIDEVTFVSNLASHQGPIFIVDSPGMGTSVFIAQIGHMLTKLYTDRIVIFLSISQLITLVKEEEGPISDTFVKALQTIVCDNVLGEVVLKSVLCPSESSEESIISVELLMDGYDEAFSADDHLALDYLKTITSLFPSIRMWITSRPHFLHRLESNFSQLGYNIQEFMLDSQLTLLTSYWSQNRKLDNERCHQFASHCLKSLKVSSTGESMASTPYVCFMIGTIFEEDALAYAREGGMSTLESEIDTDDIIDLLRTLIENRIRKYFASYRQTKLNKLEIMGIHVWLSLKLVFSDFIEQHGKQFPTPNYIELDEMLKVGLVESHGGMTFPRFVQPLTAEYFVAWFVVDRLKEDGEWGVEFNDLLMQHVLKCQHSRCDGTDFNFNVEQVKYIIHSYVFSNPIICCFIDNLLSELQTQYVPNTLATQLYSQSSLCEITHACANADYISLFKFFVGLHAFGQYASHICSYKFVFLTIKNSSLEILKTTLSYFLLSRQFNLSMQREVLRMAVRCGKFDTVEYFIKAKKLKGLVKSLDWGVRELLHDCVANTEVMSVEEIERKIELLRMLVGINPSLLKAKDVFGRTPLFCEQVHNQVIMELVELGGDVLAQDRNFNITLFEVSGGRDDWWYGLPFST